MFLLNKMQRNFLILILICGSLFSCTNAKKITQLLNKELLKNKDEILKVDSSHILLSFTKKDSLKNMIEVKKLQSKFIPAIFYWYQDAKFTIKINDSILINKLYKDLYDKYDSIKYFLSSTNSKLLLHFPELPNQFNYEIRQTTTVPLLYVWHTKEQKIIHHFDSLLVNYFIFYPNQKANFGNIILKNELSFKKSNKAYSTKKYIKNYLDYMQQSITNLNQQLIGKISKLLE